MCKYEACSLVLKTALKLSATLEVQCSIQFTKYIPFVIPVAVSLSLYSGRIHANSGDVLSCYEFLYAYLLTAYQLDFICLNFMMEFCIQVQHT